MTISTILGKSTWQSAVLLLVLTVASASDGQRRSRDIDHSPWDSMLKQYVNDETRVDYGKWKQDGVENLNGYLQRLGEPWPTDMAPQAKRAALINAYNAFTIRWILENYPTKSIWKTADPFKARRHVVNGEKLSLDGIETRLRKMGDPRIHSAVVCAARSCPPLRREAYTADRVDGQLEDNTRAWLADPDLNEFLPDRRIARISPIFKWYGQDFEKEGNSLQKFLARYAPAGKAAFLGEGKAKIQYKTYHWGLNDSSDLGSDYSRTGFLWDRFRNFF
jgi:hypothetical protein